ADAAWLKAYEAKDVDKAVSFFDEQGSMLVPNSPILMGRDAIAKFIARGYTSGKYEMSFNDASGRTISDKGKYLMVWKKQPEGAWKVLFDTSNSDLPLSPPSSFSFA